MAELSKLTMPSGNVYDLKDQYARDLIKELFNYHDYLGVTTTELVPDVTTSPNIVIAGETVTATAGDVATYDTNEFVYSSTGVWQKFASLQGLGALAFKDSASATYTPRGNVSQPEFTGLSTTFTGTHKATGRVSAPTISVSSAGATESLGILSVSVSNETLTFSTTNKTVKTGDAEYSATEPDFTGNNDSVSVSGTPNGSVSQPEFSGTAATIEVS